MKKLIAILVVMIVLVGAVFADTANTAEAQRANGKAQIIVNATVTELIPQFQLAIKSDEADVSPIKADNVELGTVSNNAVSQGAVNAEQTTMAAASVNTLTGKDTTAANVTVSFVINQVAKANLKANYSITVKASNLNLIEYSDKTAVPSTGYTLKPTEYFEVLDDTPEVTPANTTAIQVSDIDAIKFAGTSANVLQLQYTGNVQVDANKTDKILKLGSFDVTWKPNETAVAGEYQATVEIEVKSV